MDARKELLDLKSRLDRVMSFAEEVLMDPLSPTEYRQQASHTLIQAGGLFVRTLEALEKRQKPKSYSMEEVLSTQ